MAAKTLAIHLLGEYRLHYGEEPVTSISAERLQSLLVYLLLHRYAPQSRQRIAAALWPDSPENQGRSNLRNVLHQLRHALPDADDFIAVDMANIQWRPTACYSLDVAVYEAELAAIAQASADENELRRRLETAVSLYRGPLLPGAYDDWLVPFREELHQTYLANLSRLALLLENHCDYHAAMRVVQRQLQQDALDETAYVSLMRLHARLGDRAGVRRVYQMCAAVLDRELEVEPSPATQGAYQACLQLDAALPTMTAPPQPSPPRAETSLRRLPLPATPLIGREAELDELNKLLRHAECRLVTIAGPGGMGKTRLALQVAHQVQGRFRDGAAFVPLAGINDVPLILPTVAAALGIQIHGGTDAGEQLLGHLAERDLLLILDNMEQLVQGSEILLDLLAAAPHIKLLTTSRERLGFQEEWVFDLQGMALPQDPDLPLEASPAAGLFLQAARRTCAGFSVGPDDEVAIRRICRLVEGMPLALELAASWVRLLGCTEIVTEVERSLDFLTTNARNLPDRHRNLHALFAHSWALLSPQEQRVFAYLSVFRGGFDRRAGEVVAEATLPVLSALVDKSLVRRSAENRYDLHELLRQFAAQKLAELGAYDEAHNRHLLLFLDLAETAAPQLTGRDQARWFARLALDLDNLHAALRWATDAADITPAMRLASALSRFWFWRGYLVEGRHWLETLLARRAAAEPAAWPRAMYALGSAAFYQNDFPAAASWLEQCITLERQSHNIVGLAHALHFLANVRQEEQRWSDATALYLESLDLMRSADDEYGISRCLLSLGNLQYDLGCYPQAMQYFTEVEALARRREDMEMLAVTCTNLGWTSVLQDMDNAGHYLCEAIRLFQGTNNIHGIAFALEGLAGTLIGTCPETSARIFGAAEAIHQRIGVRLSPSNQAYYLQLVERVRARLDPTVLQRLWDDGSRMDLQTTIHFALQADHR